MAHTALDNRLFLRKPRNPHQQRHPRRLLEERPLLQHPVVAHHVSVLAREHHDGVVSDSCPLQCGSYLAHHTVNLGDVSHVVCPKRPPAQLGGNVLPCRRVPHHIVVLGLVNALQHELQEVIRPDPVHQRSRLRLLKERGAHGESFGIVHIHVRPVIR